MTNGSVIKSETVAYFGQEIVRAAVADFFHKNGVSDRNYERLMNIALVDQDQFFEIVSRYVERGYT